LSADTQVSVERSLIGQVLLGRYRVEACIARGGSSVVYRGHDERLRRTVCVKVFAWLDPARPGWRASYDHFVQEAFALSQLQHPHTLRIFDFGYLQKEPKLPFQVAEHVPGGTLKDLIARRGPLGLAATLEIVAPLAGALAEAHGRAIIHRDVKPSNILVQDLDVEKPLCKLADFGIAKARIIDKADSEERVLMYSPGWAAPEQYGGGVVGPEADVFALGLLTVYMITGKRLVSDSRVFHTLARRGEAEPYLASALAALGLTPDVEDVLRTACAVEVRNRFSTPDLLVEALRDCRSNASFDEKATEPLLRLVQDPPPPVASRRVAAAPTVDLPVGQLKLRLTLLAGEGGRAQLHVKGLNCFISRDGGRVTRALDVKSDTILAILSPTREVLDLVRCAMVPENGVQLDFGPGRELVLVHRGGP
jgi:serine/threonine-protein kinase